MTYPERPVFGENGVVGHKGSQRNSYTANHKKADRLIRREPRLVLIALCWLLAGPFNLIALVLFNGGLNLGENKFDLLAIALCVSIPSAIAAGIGIVRIEGRPARNISIFWLSIEHMAWISGAIFILLAIFLLPFAPFALVYVLFFTVIFGIPAAAWGALTVRLILFQWDPLPKDLQNADM